jgi:hypothetical protein
MSVSRNRKLDVARCNCGHSIQDHGRDGCEVKVDMDDEGPILCRCRCFDLDTDEDVPDRDERE